MIRIRQLNLTAMGGIPHGEGFTLSDLSPGINIIHGPNGCGKTTAARAMRDMIWHQAKPAFEAAWLEARIEDETAKKTWILRRHGARVQAECDGAAADPPEWSPADTRARHTWTLRDLMESDTGDLARRMEILMQNNVDLAAHAARLGWDAPPSAPRKLAQELKQAEDRAREVRNAQEKLLRDAAELSGRKRTLAALRTRAETAGPVQDALTLRQTAAELEEVRARLRQSPPGMADLRADDGELLKSKCAHRDALNRKHHQLRNEQNALPDPDPACADAPLSDLDQWRRSCPRLLRKLEDGLREAAEAESNLRQLDAKCGELRQRHGLAAAEEFSDSYETPVLRKYLERFAEELTLSARRDALGGDGGNQPPPGLTAETLAVAAEDLRRYRQHPGPGHPWILLHAAALTVLAVAAAWFRFHPAMVYLPALPVLLLGAQAFVLRKAAQGLRARIPAELPLPDSLSAREVDRTLDAWRDLREQLRIHAEREACETRLRDLRHELDAVRDQLNGLTPQPDPMWAAHFLEDLQTLRELRLETAAAGETLDLRRERVQETCAALRETGAPGMNACTPENAEELCEALEVRLDTEIKRRARAEQLREALAATEEDQKRVETEIASLCERIQLDNPGAPDSAELERRLAALPAWREDFRHAETLNHTVSGLRKRLEAYPDLLEADTARLEDLAREAAAAAEEADILRDSVVRLEHDISLAKQRHDLHDALEQVDSLRAQLADERARTLDLRAGAALVDWLRRETLSRQRPEVLDAAGKNLINFTGGQLTLHFNGGQFLAGAPGGVPRTLDRLSTGERAQLIMAVRLAFLDRMDRVKLPLFVDEALGTSDDTRAHAVMRALIRIAESGRQVFYFTAQHDERAKWRAALKDSAVNHREIDLAAVRGLAAAESAPLPAPPPESAAPPPPEPGEHPQTWAARAGIPAMNRHAPLSAAHLWHVVRDPEVTVRLINAGITSWGALSALLEAGGHPDLLSESQCREYRDRAEALEHSNRLWRIGRPRPLTEADLLRAPAVSETFQERVAECLREVDGDARALLRRLDEGAVNRWQRAKTGELAAWLEDEGLLSREAPLSEETIRARVLARTGLQS